MSRRVLDGSKSRLVVVVVGYSMARKMGARAWGQLMMGENKSRKMARMGEHSRKMARMVATAWTARTSYLHLTWLVRMKSFRVFLLVTAWFGVIEKC